MTEETEPISLSGNWKYFDGRFIEPADIQLSEGQMINAAVLLNDQGYDRYGYGTLSCSVIIDHTKATAISLPDTYSAYALYLNGKLIFQQGNPGKDKMEEIPARSSQLIPLTNLSDTIRIVIHLSNFHHSKYGFKSPPEVGPYQKMKRSEMLGISFDLFMTGCLAMGSFFFLGLYIFGRRSRMGLSFALFCLFYAYRIFAKEHYILQELFPSYPWWLAVRAEYISLYLCGLFFIHYIARLYRKESIPQLVFGFNIISYLFIGLALSTPVSWFTQANSIYLLILTVMIVYIIIIYIKAVINRSTHALFALLSLVLISAIFLIKTMAYFHWISEPRLLTGIGQVIFFFFQAVLLSRIFANEWITAKNDAERLSKTKSEFLSVMSHEIRTPLNAILGITYHLIGDNPKEEHAKDLQSLLKSGENLSSLVDNILDYSNMTFSRVSVEKRKTDIHKFIISEITPFRKLAEEKKLQFIIQLDPLIPQNLLVDSYKLSQILRNLVDNAIKFTETGEVKVSCTLEKKQGNDVRLLCAVQDTGIGICKEMQDEVFNVFVQANQSASRKYEGMGLGLSISRHLLDLMGAELRIRSCENKGSRFYFSLDCEIAGSSKIAEKYDDDRLLLKDKKVLIVEDNEMNAIIAKRLLKKWGLSVTHCENGIECLSKCEEDEYDMILMDLQMPEMDGYQASEILRKKKCSTPIIALTASTRQKEGDKLKMHGIDDLVSKPFRPDILYTMMCKFLLKDQTVRY